MMLFWILAVAMILAALAMVAPALLRQHETHDVQERDRQNVIIAREHLAELEAERDAGKLNPEQFEQAKLEIEQALIFDLEEADEHDAKKPGSRMLVLGALGIFVPVLTFGIYFKLGSPELLNMPGEPLVAQQSSTQQGDMHSVDEMLNSLVTRLQQTPDDAEGWYMLGRTYMFQKDYKNAAMAFDRTYQLVGDQPTVMLALADSMAMASGGSMQGRVAELIRKAVALEPSNVTALWLAGMVEEQDGNYEKAVRHWTRLEPLLGDDQASLQRVSSLIERAMEKGGLSKVMVQESTPEAAMGATIEASISLSPELQGKVGAEESLFVYARALEGPKMPLAAVRLKVKQLPITVTLNDAQAMVPQMKLSNFSQVLVGARISRSGNATASSGDLKGEIAPVAVAKDTQVKLVIDTVIP